ncbi:MAG: D-glycero-beta-D-manno-heptose 1-phosphate adenylyltransferase [Saprospiraceae bacterium]
MKTKYSDKILGSDDLLKKVEQWKLNKETIVFTNGCFDIIHRGHVDYLFKAAALGDRLIVALNSDRSVKRLKGEHRPIQDEMSRLSVMAALGCVDAVILFEEDTPEDLIKKLNPDFLVKGGDWKVENIIGSSYIIAHGGQVLTIPFIPGYSTTMIEQKIKNEE